MEKQHVSVQNFDNGMKQLIERFPGLQSRYVEGVCSELNKIPGAKQYGRAQIMRVVWNKVPLNHKNKVIRDAFMNMVKDVVGEVN